MRIYLAGGHRLHTYCQEVIRNKGHRLLSFMHEQSQIKAWREGGWIARPGCLMIDSGAHSWNQFSAEKKYIPPSEKNTKLPDVNDYLEKYLEFIKENCHLPIIFVELDVYALFTEDFLAGLREKVLSLPGFKAAYLRVYHHQYDDGSLDVLRRWIKEGQTYIGVNNEITPQLGKVFKITRDRIKLHGFGMVKKDLLDRFPFFSADSSSVLATVKYGHRIKDGVKQVRKIDVMRRKKFDLTLTLDSEYKLKEAIENYVKLERYYTRLWAARGVTWHD